MVSAVAAQLNEGTDVREDFFTFYDGKDIFERSMEQLPKATLDNIAKVGEPLTYMQMLKIAMGV